MTRVVSSAVKAVFMFFTNRLFLLLVVVIGLFYTLIQAVFQLTIIQGDQLSTDFELSVIRDISTKGQRGNIYDRNGYPLATNVMAYDVYLNDSIEVDDKNTMINAVVTIIKDNNDSIIYDVPFELTISGIDFTGTDRELLEFRKNIFSHRSTNQLTEEELAMSTLEVCKYMQEHLFKIEANYTNEESLDICTIRYSQYIKRFSKYKPEVIAYNVSTKTLAILEEKRDIFQGITIVESPYRVYEDAPYFAHIIGYTRQIDSEKLELMKPLGYKADDTIGVIGIEKELESYLRGYDGHQKVEVNNLGKTMLVLDNVASIVGNDVYLTIDHDLQIKSYQILEQQLAEILVAKLYMRYPKKNDVRFILLKDVYGSIFENELVDISLIDSENSKYQKKIFNTLETQVTKVKNRIKLEIEEDKTMSNPTVYATIYEYILKILKNQGFIEGNYKNNTSYSTFKKGGITFNAFLLELEFDSDVQLLDPDGTDIDAKEIIRIYLLNDDFWDLDFEKYMYLNLLEREYFNYIDLSMLIIEQNLVNATEDELKNLIRGRLSPIDFMKQKLLNIEITPQELALDPSSGSVVISDIDTGEILAMVSYPTYDNNRLVNHFDNKYYTQLLADTTSPLYPRATLSKSAPGSTFKMVTAMAALEEEVITSGTTVYTTGYFDKISPGAKCWIYDRGGRHGTLNVSGAIEQSCNYFFYEMGYRLSIDENGYYSDSQGLTILEEYASRFGLDSKTGIEISEASSHLPTRDAVRASIGQVDHNYTPLQLVRYMNTLVNDGQMKELNLVDKVTNKSGILIKDFKAEIVRENTFDLDNLETIKNGMLAVTEGSRGTARSLFWDLPMSIGGKTGTAELYKTRANHSIFVGFAPFDEPVISVTTVIQFGYSSKYATLNSKKIISMYFDLDSELEGYTSNYILE